MLGVDRTYDGHHEPDANDPRQTSAVFSRQLMERLDQSPFGLGQISLLAQRSERVAGLLRIRRAPASQPLS